MKTKKRYESVKQIEQEIDAAKAKAAKYIGQAEALELKARTILEQEQYSPWAREQAEFDRVQAKKYRISARRLVENRLDHLKRKLAEFQTMLLPTMDNGDQSISARE